LEKRRRQKTVDRRRNKGTKGQRDKARDKSTEAKGDEDLSGSDYENTREVERMLSVLIKRLTEGSGKGAEGQRDREM
jgi:hypothetical protein